MLNGKLVQMLIDTGYTKTTVSADYLPTDCLDHFNKEKVLCVGDEVCYPTAELRLKFGRWAQTVKVVVGLVAPEIPVQVLLGTDVYAWENRPCRHNN